MYNKQNLSITSLFLLSYMTTHIHKSPNSNHGTTNTCWSRENRFCVFVLFIFRYNVWFLTLAKILITYRCRFPAPSQPQNVFGESGTRGSNEHARHGTNSLVQHSFHLQHENIHISKEIKSGKETIVVERKEPCN